MDGKFSSYTFHEIFVDFLAHCYLIITWSILQFFAYGLNNSKFTCTICFVPYKANHTLARVTRFVTLTKRTTWNIGTFFHNWKTREKTLLCQWNRKWKIIVIWCFKILYPESWLVGKRPVKTHNRTVVRVWTGARMPFIWLDVFDLQAERILCC